MEEAVKPFGSSFIPDQIMSMLPDLSPIKYRDRLAMYEPARKTALADAGYSTELPQNGFVKQTDPDISSMINILNAQLYTMDKQKLLLPLPKRDTSFGKTYVAVSTLESGIIRAERAEAARAQDFVRDDSCSSGSHISEYFDYNEGCYEVPPETYCASVSGASNQPAVDLRQYSTPVLEYAETLLYREERKIFQGTVHPQYQQNSHFPAPDVAPGNLNDRLHQIQALMQRSSQNSRISQPEEPTVPDFRTIGALVTESPAFKQDSDALVTQYHNITKMAEELQIYRTKVGRRDPVQEPQPTPLTARLDNIRKKIRSMDTARKRDDGLLSAKALPAENQRNRLFYALDAKESDVLNVPDDVVEVESYYVSSSSNIRNSSDLLAENEQQDKRSRYENALYGSTRPSAYSKLQNPPYAATKGAPCDYETSLQVSDLRDDEDRSLASASHKGYSKNQPTGSARAATSVLLVNQNQRFFQPLQTLRQQYEMSKIQAYKSFEPCEQCEERFLTSVRRFQEKMSANRRRCCTPNQRAERIKQLMRE